MSGLAARPNVRCLSQWRRSLWSCRGASHAWCSASRAVCTAPRAAASLDPPRADVSRGESDHTEPFVAHDATQRQAHAGAALKFCVLPAHSLAANHRSELARLERMLKHVTALADSRDDEPRSPASAGASRQETFVVCAAAVETPANAGYSVSSSASSPSDACLCGSLTGVNYAYHSCVNPPRGTLKGILKGCAEQNALGAVAAQGMPYSCLAHVYLASVHRSAANLERCTLPFPCPECWRKLLRVSQLRVSDGRPPLQMFLRAPAHREHMLRIMEKAKQEVAVCQTDIHVTLVVD